MRGGILRWSNSTATAGETQVTDIADDYDNVEDFIEHYLIRMADRYADGGNARAADAVYDVLDKYIAKEIAVQLLDGQVYVVPIEIIEDIEYDT